MNLTVRLLIGIVATTGLLSGCLGGGGGGGSSSGVAAAPVAAGLVQEPDREATPEQSEPVTVTLLQVNDLHAHLMPFLDRVADGTGGTQVVERGGLARMATLIGDIRAQNPQTLVMNIGDTFHGGVEAMYTLGNAIVDPVNALGIDVGVPGNWDFGFGPIVFRLRFSDDEISQFLKNQDDLYPDDFEVLQPNYPNLAANLSNLLDGTPVLPATLLRDIAGVRVGFIGLTSDIVHHMHALLGIGMVFTGENVSADEAEAAYRELVNTHAAQLRADGADAVVVLSELGLHKDHRLAQLVDPGSVDVFFSAHTHEVTHAPLTSASGALVVEAGNAGYLGRMDITLSNGVVTDRRWELLPVDASIADDPRMDALVTAARAPFLDAGVDMVDPMPVSAQTLDRPIDTVVGHASHALDRRHALENSFNRAMADILREFGSTSLALTPGFRFDSVIAPGELLEDNTVASGDITLEDVYRFLPVSYTVAAGEVTGARLKEILEGTLTHVYSQRAFNHKGGWLDGLAGLSLTMNLGASDGARINAMALSGNGQPIADNTVVTVTGCRRPVEVFADVLCGYGGFSNVMELLQTDGVTPWTAIDVLARGLENAVPFDSTRRDIVDLDSTPAWPQTPYVQPLPAR